MRPDRYRPAVRQRGFTLPSAIFLVVILSLLGAAIVSLSTTQQMSSAQDMQGSRAYWAARAALDYGLYQVLDPENATAGAANFAACPAVPQTVTLPAFAGFTVQITDCSRTATYDDNGLNIAVYRLTARASQGGAVGSPTYVERQLTISAAKCKDPNAVLADGTTADARHRCQ